MIPVIAKADTISRSELTQFKARVSVQAVVDCNQANLVEDGMCPPQKDITIIVLPCEKRRKLINCSVK